MSERILPLAGVFQATELVRQAANHGTWSGFAATTCLNSLFCLEAEDAESVYGGTNNLRLGLETLLAVLSGDQHHAESLQQAIGLLHLQKKFSRNRSMQREVGETLDQIAGSHPDLPLHERQDNQAEEVARLYCRTISGLSPRIVVHGRPQYLQNDRTVNWIRTLLFAGLRSAVLWDQLGGGRFSLLFGRKRMMSETRDILDG